ncbi:hypothetical protein TWF506_007211 [Arthrobotrys conoides]|uniref:Uncharacterized protein n=1 Tax=Arthrobotrys conoides TaxID=74498 RepID=A0AAN8NNS7_9PEZI
MHTWAFNLIPHLLIHCPMLDDMEIEIKSVFYAYPAIHYPHDLGVLMPVNLGANQVHLRNFGGIYANDDKWVPSGNWIKFFWVGLMEELSGKRRERKLSRFSVTLTGRSLISASFAIRNVWHILDMMDVLNKIDQLEVRDLHTSRMYQSWSSPWFIITVPAYLLETARSQVRSTRVKRLELECGEHQTCGLTATTSQIMTSFPNIESLFITKVGLFTQRELVFLDALPTLRTLNITEKSTPDLENDDGPDSMHATNLLVECMELLLNLQTLQMIEWNRGGYQRVRCEITRDNFRRIEFVDVWLTIGEEKVLVGERYDGWYFREELFYGTGSEYRWLDLWKKQFVHDSMGDEPFEFEDQEYLYRDEEVLSEGPAEAIPW